MAIHDQSKEAIKAMTKILGDKTLVLGGRLEYILGGQRLIDSGIPRGNTCKKLSREIELFSSSIETTSEPLGESAPGRKQKYGWM